MILLILVFLLSSTTPDHFSNQQPKAGNAQPQVNTENLKRQAQELSDAVVKADYARAADLTYPKLIRLMGGRAQFIAQFEKSMKEMQSDRFRLSEIVVDEPRDVVKVGREYYGIVPSKMSMKVKEGTLGGEAFLIGISTDGGQNWSFVDSAAASDKTLLGQMFGPAVARKLRIPEPKRPVLHRLP